MKTTMKNQYETPFSEIIKMDVPVLQDGSPTSEGGQWGSDD